MKVRCMKMLDLQDGNSTTNDDDDDDDDDDDSFFLSLAAKKSRVAKINSFGAGAFPIDRSRHECHTSRPAIMLKKNLCISPRKVTVCWRLFEGYL